MSENSEKLQDYGHRTGGFLPGGLTTRQDFIEEARAAFGEWVKKYGVKNAYPVDQFESSSFDPNHVWTELWDDGGWVITGYSPYSQNSKFPAIGYYTSKEPWDIEDGDDICVSTSLLLPCKDCSLDTEEDDGLVNSECQSCLGEGDFFEFQISP